MSPLTAASRTTTSSRIEALPGILPVALLAAAVLVSAAPRAAGAQGAGEETAPDSTAVLYGEARFAASGEAVEGVEVRIGEDGPTAVTGPDGGFRLEDLRPGTHTLTVRYLGDRSAGTEVRLEPGAREEVVLEVYEKVVRGDRLRVTVERPEHRSAKMQGFDRRREKGAGTFVTEEEIRRHGGIRLADVFRNQIGIDVERCAGRGSAAADCFRLESSHRSCQPAVYLDGALVSTPGRPSVLADVPVEWVAGIEIYSGPASVPAEFRTGQGCGAVLLWTRT